MGHSPPAVDWQNRVLKPPRGEREKRKESGKKKKHFPPKKKGGPVGSRDK